MYVVSVWLTRRNSAIQYRQEAAILLDLLWAHATEGDRIEHIRIRAGPERVAVVLFLGAGSEQESRAAVTRLLATAYESSKLFSENYVDPAAGWEEGPGEE